MRLHYTRVLAYPTRIPQQNPMRLHCSRVYTHSADDDDDDLLHIKTSNPTLLREGSRTADQCKQTGRENGPRLKRKCLNSVCLMACLKAGLPQGKREIRRCRLQKAHCDGTANQISSSRGVQAGN